MTGRTWLPPEPANARVTAVLDFRPVSDRQDPRESCRCEGGPTGDQHRALVMRVDRSFEQDRERAIFSQTVNTSEGLRRRAVAPMNGHT